MSNTPQYWEQYNRVKRWYKRFKVINDGRSHDMTSDNYQDDVYAFFLNCYHLKDWILNDPSRPSFADLTHEFMKQSTYLTICHDISNNVKHYKLKGAHVGRRYFGLGLGQDAPLINVKYEIIEENGKVHDAFEVATKALAEWDQFLSTHDPRFKDNLEAGILNG